MRNYAEFTVIVVRGTPKAQKSSLRILPVEAEKISFLIFSDSISDKL